MSFARASSRGFTPTLVTACWWTQQGVVSAGRPIAGRLRNPLSSLSLSLSLYIYIYTYIHTYTHTHTHIYIYIYKLDRCQALQPETGIEESMLQPPSPRQSPLCRCRGDPGPSAHSSPRQVLSLSQDHVIGTLERFSGSFRPFGFRATLPSLGAEPGFGTRRSRARRPSPSSTWSSRQL